MVLLSLIRTIEKNDKELKLLECFDDIFVRTFKRHNELLRERLFIILILCMVLHES